MRSFLLSAVLAVVFTQQCKAVAMRAAIAKDDPRVTSMGVLCGVDWTINDIAGIQEPSPEHCFEVCFNKYYSTAVQTWTNYNGGTCWCKNDIIVGKDQLISEILTPNAGAITLVESAFLKPEDEGRVVAVYNSMDMPGNDIGYFLTSELLLCWTTCAKSNRCFAFVMTLNNGGTCYLKGRASALVPMANGAFSYAGVVMRRASERICRPL